MKKLKYYIKILKGISEPLIFLSICLLAIGLSAIIIVKILLIIIGLIF